MQKRNCGIQGTKATKGTGGTRAATVLARVALLSCWLLAFTAAAAPTPPNWPQFRGVNAAGVSTEARPPLKIGPAEGVLWKVEVP